MNKQIDLVGVFIQMNKFIVTTLTVNFSRNALLQLIELQIASYC